MVKHIFTLVVLLALLLSQSGVAFHLEYCIEYFELEDGSICSMEMGDKDAGELQDGILSLRSSNSCCASRIVEANHRIPALVKEIKQNDKASVTAVFPYQDFPLTNTSEGAKQADNRHSHSPPLGQLIVQSAVLLI
ncbi:MAG: hypothetical protein HYY49_03545 [Ignavibacteriales bacterium]|nr:hypothetical protein [Ignavibacteriales bacterium]